MTSVAAEPFHRGGEATRQTIALLFRSECGGIVTLAVGVSMDDGRTDGRTGGMARMGHKLRCCGDVWDVWDACVHASLSEGKGRDYTRQKSIPLSNDSAKDELVR